MSKVTPTHDFLRELRESNKNSTTISAEFSTYPEPQDILVRGGQFYACWDPVTGLWNTNRSYAYKIIDEYIGKLKEHYDKHGEPCNKYLFARNASSRVCDRFNHYCEKLLNEVTIDGASISMNSKLTFLSDPPKRENYATLRLDYDMKPGSHESFDAIMDTLYDPDEKHKICWCIGSIFAGDSVNLQKFLVLYGPAGAGKSTILNIVEQLFKGYTSTFDAKSLGGMNNTFSLEAFKDNPLVAIQHDGDLSHIVDNTKLNSLVSHERLMVNPKFGRQFQMKFNSFLMMGTNTPVRITDQKSGLIRRLIDTKPSGRKLSRDEYRYHTSQIEFEKGAIADYCMRVYLDNPGAYDDYKPLEMISVTNDFYNFVLDSFNELNSSEVTLNYAYNLYKNYNAEGNMECVTRTKFREELKNYFTAYENNTFIGFKTDIFTKKEVRKLEKRAVILPKWLLLKEQKSILDTELANYPAQEGNANETPKYSWDNCKTILSQVDTTKVHYINVPETFIVIDFDLKNDEGEKSLQKNLEAAMKFPKTYAETSKSGGGLHLHYWYDGVPSQLSSIFDEHIEVKVYKGNSSLRRKLALCNDEPVAHISSGLPLRKEKKAMMDKNIIEGEAHIRNMISKNIRKEIHDSTHSSICFIKDFLDEAIRQNVFYDVRDMQDELIDFAMHSTNQSEQCLTIVSNMKLYHFATEGNVFVDGNDGKDLPIVHYDIEVFSNLLLVCYAYDREDWDTYDDIRVMINPSPEDMKRFMNFKLCGFNNVAYDNHIIYARSLGYSNAEMYKLSQDIVTGEGRGFYIAKHISYTDIFDFASTKQSLKKWEIAMGIRHLELGLDWNKPAPEELWDKIAEYCKHDVYSTRALFHFKKKGVADIPGDWIGRQILADISGLSCNHSNNDHSKAIIFGDDKTPDLVYTDLKTGEQFYNGEPYESTRTPGIITSFPDYEYVLGEDGRYHNMMRGVDLSFGGWVYVKEGIYKDVALIDVASLHPTSMRQLDIFGKYNKRFCDIVDLRLDIKHKKFDNVKKMFDGKLEKYLDDPTKLNGVKQALKMVINPVYGLTSAKFDNPFRDKRNKNNIVALRGALFMKELFDAVVAEGYEPIHIKTDSIKIANADQHIVDFCCEFAKKYGYEFEHEATYDRLCIVNKSTYVAHSCYGEHCGEWTATAAQFQKSYVFKTLFTKEPIEFEDCCEVKESKAGVIYIDKNEQYVDVTEAEKELDKVNSAIRKNGESPELLNRRKELAPIINNGHNYIFVGRVGQFTPLKSGCRGGELKVVRNMDAVKNGEEKPSFVTGANGYRWMESAMVETLGLTDQIDHEYYATFVDDARDAINEYTSDVDAFCDLNRNDWYDYVIPF